MDIWTLSKKNNIPEGLLDQYPDTVNYGDYYLFTFELDCVCYDGTKIEIVNSLAESDGLNKFTHEQILESIQKIETPIKMYVPQAQALYELYYVNYKNVLGL